MSSRPGVMALVLLLLVGGGAAALAASPEAEEILPLGIIAWNDRVILLTQLNSCEDLSGPDRQYDTAKGEIFVSSDGGHSWSKRIAADTGYFHLFLATPTTLWIAGSHTVEAPGESAILVATSTEWHWLEMDTNYIEKLAVAEDGELVAWVENAVNFLEDRWVRRVWRSRDGGRTWHDIGAPRKVAMRRDLKFFKKISDHDEHWRTIGARDEGIQFEVQYRANRHAPWQTMSRFPTCP